MAAPPRRASAASRREALEAQQRAEEPALLAYAATLRARLAALGGAR